MTRPNESRSRTDRDAFTIVFFLLLLSLAGIHLYLGLIAGFVSGVRRSQFVIIGLMFLAGSVLYFTPYWRPVFHLLGAGFALYLGGLWLLGGMEYFFFGLVVGVVGTAFILVNLYLFVRRTRTRINTSVTHD